MTIEFPNLSSRFDAEDIRKLRVIIPGYVEPRVRCQRARVPKKESRPS